ncbi:hypothetical protein C0991_003453 [Blastosporella zonata]|nr:hypothetical protein C0991_003453 [Blastosporella zonata]
MTDVVDTEKGSNSDAASQQVFERPTGLKGLYYHPLTQVNFLAASFFITSDTSIVPDMYSGFRLLHVPRSINNKLGSRTTLMLGTTGYALYVGSYLAINIHPGAKGFVIAAGAILGICAGLLWTAQGALMMAYPTEGEKGKYIGVFWTIFNLGGVVGASVALGQNFKSTVSKIHILRSIVPEP